jgi:hypothetical protein
MYRCWRNDRSEIRSPAGRRYLTWTTRILLVRSRHSQNRSSRVGLINILGLIALAGWSQPSSAQSTRPPTTTPPAPQCNLLHEQRIVRQLECLATVRLQAERHPHPSDRGLGKASFRHHRADRPVCRVDRCRAQRPLDHGGNLIVVDSSRSARASLIKQSIAAIFQKSATPLADCVFVEAKLAATSLLAKPSAHRRMTRHRSDSDRATRRRRTCLSKYVRSSALSINGAIGLLLLAGLGVRSCHLCKLIRLAFSKKPIALGLAGISSRAERLVISCDHAGDGLAFALKLLAFVVTHFALELLGNLHQA